MTSDARRQAVEALLDEVEELEDTFARWQSEPLPSSGETAAGRRRYEDWYARALAVVPDEDKARFRDMYEGGRFTQRIKAFLSRPHAKSAMYDPTNPLLSQPWEIPFDATPRESLATQREILRAELHRVAAPSAALEELGDMFRRLPDFLDVLRASANPQVPVPDLQDEADLQVLVHALLRMRYGDVRAEDPVPQYAGRASRTDFLLRDAGVLVETKFTRAGLRDKQLGDELLQDLGRYPRHPDCRAIFILIYDPARHVLSPTALEHDLSNDGAIPKRAIVVR